MIPSERQVDGGTGPLVSIITPVLNRADSIERCLASVQGQVYGPIEHIVVDGGSTDGTLEVLDRRGSQSPLRWISERDHGMYDAINKGMRLANGRILAYLNSDDLYFPWTVSVAVEALRPDVDLVYGDLGILNKLPDRKTASFYLQFYRDFDLRYYSFVGTIAQPTVFWKRALVDRIGMFDPEYRLIGDCEYWLRAARHGARLVHISEVMAVQLDHAAALRWAEAATLQDEFVRLRGEMRNVIDPPKSLRSARVKQRILWRMRHLQFFYASTQRKPLRWTHFIEALRTGGVEIRARDLRMLAPKRWRGSASLFGDPARIDRLIGLGSAT